MSVLDMSPLSGLFGKYISNDAVSTVNSPIRLSYNTDILHISLTSCRFLFRNMPKRSLLRMISILLLFDIIAVLCTLGMILPIVAETRPIDASVTFVISVSVTSTDFVQIEDCIVAFV